MASVQTSSYDGRYLKLTVTEESYSINDNTSTVKWVLESLGGNSNYYNIYSCEVKIDNVTKYGPISTTWDSRVFPSAKGSTSGTVVIQHNTDGTASPVTFSLKGSVFNNNPQTYSDALTLTTIPRASEVTCSSGNIEDVLAVKIISNSNTFTHTIEYTIGTLNGTLATKTSQTSLDFNTASIKDSIYSQIPNDTSINGTIRCTTYSGNTQIGDVKTSSFSLSVSRDRSCPTITGVSCIDTNISLLPFTGSNQKFIRYKSLPQVDFTATARNSTSIASLYISMNGGQAFTSKPCTFTNMVSNIITIIATDTRGFSASYQLELDLIPYVELSISGDVKRDEELSVEGFFSGAIGFYNGSLGLVNNTLSVSYDYKLSTASSFTTGGTISNYTLSGNKAILNHVSLGNNYNPDYEYVIRIYVTDSLGTKFGDIVFQKGMSVVEIGDEYVNVNGNYYQNNVLLDNIYLKQSGGTISGNLNVTGDLKRNNSNVALLSDVPTKTSELTNDSGYISSIPSNYLKETVLYSNSTGSNGDITLSDSVANYSYIEIYFMDNNGVNGGYTKLYNVNGTDFELSLVEGTIYNTFIRRTAYSASGMTLIVGNKGYIQIGNSIQTVSDNNYLYITKVVGIN